MRCGACFVMALGACGFQATAADPGAAGSSGSPTPDATMIGLDAAPIATAPTEYCGPTQGTAVGHVMVCFEFDGSADDGSIHRLKTHTSNVAFVAGPPGMGEALSFAGNSAADLDDSSVFDAAAITIELWIDPATQPNSTVNLLDVNNQYALLLKDNGDLDCTLSNGTSIDASANIQANRWTHVACTYDDATGKSVIYVDGSEVNSQDGDNNKPLSTSGTTGLSLSADNAPKIPDQRAPMVGMLDQVRLLNVARSAAEICADSGLASCQ